MIVSLLDNSNKSITINDIDFIDLDLLLKICKKHKLTLTIRFDEGK